jgi:hypothetical protein
LLKAKRTVFFLEKRSFKGKYLQKSNSYSFGALHSHSNFQSKVHMWTWNEKVGCLIYCAIFEIFWNI